MSEEKIIWKTEEEFNVWFDAYYKQQVEPVVFVNSLDNKVNTLVADGMDWVEAFDKVYTVDVLKKLGYLDADWEQPEKIKTMKEVLDDIDSEYTVMIKKESTTEKSNTNDEE
jgi:hypothetical protein